MPILQIFHIIKNIHSRVREGITFLWTLNLASVCIYVNSCLHVNSILLVKEMQFWHMLLAKVHKYFCFCETGIWKNTSANVNGISFTHANVTKQILLVKQEKRTNANAKNKRRRKIHFLILWNKNLKKSQMQTESSKKQETYRDASSSDVAVCKPQQWANITWPAFDYLVSSYSFYVK